MTTLAQCWKVTRTDAQVFAFTDHDRNLTVDGVTYKAAIGFIASAVERSTELKTDNQQLTGLIDDDSITTADLRTGKFSGARIDVIEVDWSTETKVRDIVVGFLGEVELAGSLYRATQNSIESELEQPIGRTVQLPCDANLGDTRCGYTLTADSGTVTVVNSRLSFTDTSRTEVDGYYNGGKLTCLTGDNAGLTFDVKRYVAAIHTIELYEPMPYDAQADDTFNIYRGCDKTLATCRDTFSNIDNHRGFAYVPGTKDLVSGNT